MAARAEEWLQLNVALTRRGGSALSSARVILRGVENVLTTQDQRSTSFFFQRKLPDLRLRFHGVRERLLLQLRQVMSRARSGGHIVRYFRSVYEPEYRQFGGRECMKAVHAYWSNDSFNWIAMDRLAEAGVVAFPPKALMPAILDELFWRMLADSGEVWDTWCNLATLLRSELTADEAATIPLSLEMALQMGSASEVNLISRYQQANAALAEELSRAWHLGRMQCGIRSILPYVALFTLNRHGFHRAEMAAITGAMAALRNPKQYLRGAKPDRTSAGTPNGEALSPVGRPGKADE